MERDPRREPVDSLVDWPEGTVHSRGSRVAPAPRLDELDEEGDLEPRVQRGTVWAEEGMDS